MPRSPRSARDAPAPAGRGSRRNTHTRLQLNSLSSHVRGRAASRRGSEVDVRRSKPSAHELASVQGVRVLVIDNYDSFTYNLVQYLGELGAEVTVVRNDHATVDELLDTQPDRVVVSPGPCTPN